MEIAIAIVGSFAILNLLVVIYGAKEEDAEILFVSWFLAILSTGALFVLALVK